MGYRWALSLFVITVLCSLALGADTAKKAPATTVVGMDMVAKIKVGSSTRAEVTELLGSPWRLTNDGDCHPVNYPETWEYLGQDAGGSFKINIQFDEAGIARLISRSTAKGSVIVLAAAPPPRQNHAH